MPQGNKHKSHFTRGEYSVAGLARADLEQALDAAEIQENLVPVVSGAAQFRPGTDYLAATPSGNQSRIIAFVRDVDDFAILELSAGKLRVMVDDAIVRRAASGLTIDEGDFDATGTWTLSASAGAAVAITGGQLVMDADAAGSTAYAEQLISITGTDLDRIQALRFDIPRGPVVVRMGTTSNGQEVFRDQILEDGTHSLAFTPTTALGTSYYLRISTRFRHESRVNSVQFESDQDLELDAPWTALELRELAFDQSADIVYFSHQNWPQVAVERRGTTSWSLVTFKPEGGPVTLVDDGVLVDPSGTHGNVTITANANIFEPGMVDGLIRLYHDDFNQTFELAGDDEWSDVWTVQGIRGQYANDRRFTYSISGSWSGTIRMQRSVSGEAGQYLDFSRDEGTTATAITGNTSVTHTGADEDNNVLGYHRIGFKASEYTSGSATINVNYPGDSGYGWGRITGYNSPSSINVEVQSPFNSSAKSKSWELPTWGWDTTYPSSVVLYDNRLVFGGRSRVWASAVNAFRDFDNLSGNNLATWERDLASGGKSSFTQWMLPLQRLLIGTEGAIVSMRAGRFNEALTTANVTLKDCATVGCNYVSPVKLDSRGIFVHSSGADMYALKPGGQDYYAERLTIWNEDILNEGVVELAAQREPDTHVWAVRGDGQCAVMLYEWADRGDLMGWWRFITDGAVESVTVVPGDEEDRVYMVVNRSPDTINNPETGAEELAPNGVDVASLDLTDQSILVVDSSNQANDKNSEGQLDAWGLPTGPDSLLGGGALKLVIDPDTGYLAFPPHNLAPGSHEFELAGWIKEDLNVDLSPWQVQTDPAGNETLRLMTANSPSGLHYMKTPVTSRVASSGLGTQFEISFWARYAPVGVFVEPWDERDISVAIAADATDFRLGSHAWYGINLDTGVATDIATMASADYVINSVTVGDMGADYFRRIVIRATTLSDDCTVYLLPCNDDDGGRLWGVNIAYLENAGTQGNGNATFVQHNTGAARVLLPYEDGKGIRREDSGLNLLTSSQNFSANYISEGVTVDFGNATDPTLLNRASILVESGTGVTRHGLIHEVAGDDDQYLLSLLVRKSAVGWIALRVSDATGSYLVNFNTQNGLVALESNVGLSSTEAGVEDYNNDWWCLWITAEVAPTPPATWSSAGSCSVTWDGTLPQFASIASSTTSWVAANIEEVDMTSSASATSSFVGEEITPTSNFYDNGDLETGDTTSWTNVVSSSAQTTRYGMSAYEGSYWLSGNDSTAGGSPRADNFGDLLNEFTQAEIDAGTAQVNISYYYGRADGSNTIFVQLSQYNASFSAVEFIESFSYTDPTNDTWNFREVGPITINTAARYIRVRVQGVGFAFDNIVGVRAEVTDPAWTASGVATGTFVGEQESASVWGAPGVATSSFIPEGVGILSSPGIATVSWSGEASDGGTLAASSQATSAFIAKDIIEEPFTSAGAALTSWSAESLTGQATVAIYLANDNLVDIDSNNRPVYEQTEGLGHIIWGAQFEKGRTRPSTPIITERSLTRDADAIVADLASVPWDDQAVTLFGEYARDNPSAGVAFGVINGSDSHSLEVDASSQPVYRITDGGVDQAEITGAVVAEDVTVRLASSAAPNDAKLVVDSGSELTDTSVTMPTIASGTVQVGGSGFDGYISRLMLLPQTSTEAELQGYGVTVEPPTLRYIEKLALRSEAEGGTITKTVDSGLFFAGPVSTVNLAHLTERTNIVAWGTDANGATGPITGLSSDVNGDVTLPGTYTNLTIGLAYTARYRSGKLAWGGQGGTALLQRKRVGGLGLILQNTHRDAIRYGADFDQLREMPRIYKGATQGATTVYDVYDDHAFDFPGFWDTDSRVCLQIQAPYPARLLGMVMSIEMNEKGL